MRELTNSQPMPMFSRDDAIALIKEMRELYGTKFDRQWETVKPQDMLNKFIQVISCRPAQVLCGFRCSCRVNKNPHVKRAGGAGARQRAQRLKGFGRLSTSALLCVC